MSRSIYCRVNNFSKFCVVWWKECRISTSVYGFIIISFFFHKMSYEDINNANLDQPEKCEVAHFVWQYFAVINNTNARKGCTKNAVCMFCDKSFSGCSTSRAAAHILGRPVLAQEKAGIRSCMAIYKKDDDRVRTAQKTMGEMMLDKEQSMDGKKRKQQVMDKLLVSPSKQSVE